MAQILVVDDDDILASFLELKLSGTNVDVVSAYSAKEALKLLSSSFEPSLILLDINMPEVGGLVLLETIRTNPSFQNINVIILSGTHDTEKLERARSLGVSDIIAKPFDNIELYDKVMLELALN